MITDPAIIRYLEGAMETAIWQARRSALTGTEGRVYRSFFVGSWIIGWDGWIPPTYRQAQCLIEPDPAYVPLSPHFHHEWGENRYPKKGGDKFCAERIALDKFIVVPWVRYIPLVVTAGDNQPDGETGIDGATLPPCGGCRRMMMASSLFDLDTLIVTTGLHEDSPIEYRTLGEILTIYPTRPA